MRDPQSEVKTSCSPPGGWLFYEGCFLSVLVDLSGSVWGRDRYGADSESAVQLWPKYFRLRCQRWNALWHYKKRIVFVLIIILIIHHFLLFVCFFICRTHSILWATVWDRLSPQRHMVDLKTSGHKYSVLRKWHGNPSVMSTREIKWGVNCLLTQNEATAAACPNRHWGTAGPLNAACSFILVSSLWN